MASSLTSLSMLLFLAAALLLGSPANAQLSRGFHDSRCPNLRTIVRDGMRNAVSRDRRMAASILRMFFHDCFVNGCDGSVLLDDTSSFTGEKGAPPNANSLRGFEVIDDIKSRVEAACPNAVSCADILALAARKGVELDGGPTWDVQLGRRDSRTASLSAVTANIPSPFSNLQTLISSFANKGFSANEMVALSGAHTIGFAQCRTFRSRIYNDTNIDPAFATERRANCPSAGGDSNLAALDRRTPGAFDNSYFGKLLNRRGLLHSDQELFNGGSTDAQVQLYNRNEAAFRRDFADAMVKMANLVPLTGTAGEIRRNCRFVN